MNKGGWWTPWINSNPEFNRKIDFCILMVLFVFPFVFVLDLDRFSGTAGPRGLDLLAQFRFCFHRSSVCARA
jgi:hypothetical protein